MAKPLKIILSLFVALVVLVFVLAKLFINEEQIKQQLQQLAQQQTNGSLQISGELGLSLFPRLGLSLGELSYRLDNESTVLAKLETLTLGVKIRPLLSGRIAIDTVSLSGLKLQLTRDSQGIGNWQTVLKESDASTEPLAAQSQPATTDNVPATDIEAEKQALALTVATLSISNTSIVYNDLASGESYVLENFSADSEQVNIDGDAFPLSLAFDLSLSEPQLHTQLKLATTASINLQQQHYRFDNVKLHTSLQGEPTAGKLLQASIEMNADINVADEVAAITALQFAFETLRLNAELNASNWSEQLALDAHLKLDQFNPRPLFSKLGITLPAFENPNSLTALSLTSDLHYRDNQAELKAIELTLDKTKLRGTVSLLDIEALKIKTVLAIDTINLDDYQSPAPAKKTGAVTKTTASPVNANTTEAELLPLDTLRELNYHAVLSIDKLQANGLELTQLKIKSTANKGIVKLNKFTGKLYGGKIRATATINASKATPIINFHQTVSNVSIKPIARATGDIDWINGSINFNSRLKTRGNTNEAVLRHLNGPINFSINKLVIDDINLEHLACQGIALANGKSMGDASSNSTTVKVVKGKIQVSNGVMKISSLNGEMNTMNLKGHGAINPIKERMDIKLGLRVAGDQINKNSACRVNSRYRDIYWPVRCKGRFDAKPTNLCKLDEDELAKIIGDAGKKELKKKAKDELKDLFKKWGK